MEQYYTRKQLEKMLKKVNEKNARQLGLEISEFKLNKTEKAYV